MPKGQAPQRYWYREDGRGNVVALTDVNGTVVDRYAYDAWGSPTSVTEAVPQRLRYAGYWYDQELGWYWVSVRAYSPALRRWLQPDPSGQDGMHTYVYVGDDPIDGFDTTGLSPQSWNDVSRDFQVAADELSSLYQRFVRVLLLSSSHNSCITRRNPAQP